MNLDTRHVALLGSTGSIGRNTLEVIAASGGRLRAVGLTAHSRLDVLEHQAVVYEPTWIVAADERASERYAWSRLPATVRRHAGRRAIAELVAGDDVDIVVAAIVGSAGLRSTWAALAAGKQVALANKETLVMAGPLVMDLARRSGATLLPVDSEHSAVFQALRNGQRSELKRIVLTASGGPFRTKTLEQMRHVTIQDALDHPTWTMGKKITVDSATMMNKALEIIEARWLFDLAPEQISVVVHPQSIVHSMVEFRDGSVFAQLSPPDMRLPIQYALTYPQRWDGPADRFDFTRVHTLQFEPPDLDRFPALRLGYEVAEAGGTAGAVLNAANEAAVARFLEGQLPFGEIVPACRDVLRHHHFETTPSLETLERLDDWAREEVLRWA